MESVLKRWNFQFELFKSRICWTSERKKLFEIIFQLTDICNGKGQGVIPVSISTSYRSTILISSLARHKNLKILENAQKKKINRDIRKS